MKYREQDFDYWYLPSNDISPLLKASPRLALIVGGNDPALAQELTTIHGMEVRHHTPGERRSGRIPTGVVLVESDETDSWLLVIGRGRGPRVEQRRGRLRDLAPSHPISELIESALDGWSDARQAWTTRRFLDGDLVQRLSGGSIGRIAGVVLIHDEPVYNVEIDARLVQIPESGLQPAPAHPEDPETWLREPPASRDAIAQTLTWLRLRNPLSDVVYSFGTSNTKFRAYQFRPVMKVLQLERARLLIADEVGLGKTIEAGLIWSELEQRKMVASALVVCPSSLRHKWQEELRLRFNRRLPILNKAMLGDVLENIRAGSDRPFQGIVSLEMLRTAKREVEELVALLPRIDLVIIDEAHALRNRGTKSYDLGRDLADLAESLVLLSATPINLKRDDLFNLLNLLDEQQFHSKEVFEEQAPDNKLITNAISLLRKHGADARWDALAQLKGLSLQDDPDMMEARAILASPFELTHSQVVEAMERLMSLHSLARALTRTRKVDTKEKKAIREPLNGAVTWTDDEVAAYQAVLRTYKQRARQSGTPVGFALQMPVRQAASCLPVAVAKLQNSQTDWSDEDDPDNEVQAPISFTVPRVALPRGTSGLYVDSKYDVFVDTLNKGLKQGSGQALVFSFFRGTLAYLEQRLTTDLGTMEGSGQPRVRSMHGGVPVADRQRLMAEFRHGKFDVLLCSEVAAEGLDFEFCNVLVNYDLPWNPMRVEQRIGRIDRFGQKHDKLFIINMLVPGTIETDIFQRLYERIGVFEETIGDLEPILQDLEEEIPKILDPTLTEEQQRERMGQYELALEREKKDLGNISESDVLISGLDEVLVDGFTDTNPSPGKYIGGPELVSFVRACAAQNGGSLSRSRSAEDTWRLSGNSSFVAGLRRLGRGGGSESHLDVATAVAYDGALLTLDPAELEEGRVSLLTATHPVVQYGAALLAEEPQRIARWGVVSGDDWEISGDMLAVVALLQTTGTQPRQELEVVAVDIGGRIHDDVGVRLMADLAEGKLKDGGQVGRDVQSMYERAKHELSHRRADLQERRARENDARVQRRLYSRSRDFDLRIKRDSEVRDRILEERRDATIWQRRVQRLLADKEETLREIELSRKLVVELTVCAAVWISAHA